MASHSSPSPREPVLHHPSLNCKLRGKRIGDTIQYRGIPYAHIPARWQHSVPLKSVPLADDSIYDAMRYGPACPQKRGAREADVDSVGPGIKLPLEQDEKEKELDEMSEFGCLTANIIIPAEAAKEVEELENRNENESLPVLVWVHGGSLSWGCSSWPQYRLTHLVEHFAHIGKPVIGVSVNYRVGILGFLADREMGVRGNFGYRDLVQAFRWVRRHVGGFGGDGRNVTAAGESAGAIALSTLLCAEVGIGEEQGRGLFDRAVVMSGDASLRRPRSWEWHTEMLKDQIKLLGLNEGEMGKEDVARVLREWDAVDLCQKLPMTQYWCGVVDGEFLKSRCGLDELGDGGSAVGKPAWCREIVFGDTGADATCLKSRILDPPTALERLHAACNAHLTPALTHTLLSAYRLPLAPKLLSTAPDYQCKDLDKNPEQAIHVSLLQLATDLRFHLPTLTTHHGWLTFYSTLPPRRAHRYHFHVKSPFPGPFHGHASHELDVAFLLQNWNYLLDEDDVRIAKGFSDELLQFVWGEGWGNGVDEVDERPVLVFTSEGSEGMGEGEYDRRWRYGRGEKLRGIGAEVLWRVAEEWQGVRPDVG